MKISEKREYIDMAGRKVFISHRRKHHGIWYYHGFQIDHAKNAISGWRLWKSEGQDAHGDMMSHIIREASVGMKLEERQAVILERLIEASETDIALPVRVGPKMYGNAMPTYLLTETEIWSLELTEQIENGGAQTKQRHQQINNSTERKAKCSRERITRMEECFGWISKYVYDEDFRKIVLAYIEVKARKWEWDRYVEVRNRRNPTKDAWVRRTIYRRIEMILQLIEEGLRKDAIILRDGAGLQVAHEEAKPSCKSITSDDLRKRVTPDAELSAEAA